jgi:hypothetical protein
MSLDALVASPHWEYTPTVAVRGSAVDGIGIIVAISERGIEAVDSEGWRGLVNPDFIRPDVEHPCNHGHLLTLVRKAWGPDADIDVGVGRGLDGKPTAVIIIWHRGPASLGVGRRRARRRRLGQFMDITLGPALAAALLAAPAKAGEP